MNSAFVEHGDCGRNTVSRDANPSPIPTVPNCMFRGDESLPSVRRGMIRYLFVILDLSKAVRDNDLKPSRRLVLLEETTVRCAVTGVQPRCAT